MSKSQENVLEKSRVLIEGVNNNDAIKARIAPIYPEERLATGPVLYDSARAALNNQAIEKAEGVAAVKAFNTAKDAVHDHFVTMRNWLRYFFKSDIDMQNAAYLNEDIPGNYAQWDSLVERTFTSVLSSPPLIEKLTLVDITSERIVGWQDDLKNVEQLKLVAEKEDGEAQAASVKKRETMAALKAYCSDLRECLNLFYHGSERQVLEQVGITVK